MTKQHATKASKKQSSRAAGPAGGQAPGAKGSLVTICKSER